MNRWHVVTASASAVRTTTLVALSASLVSGAALAQRDPPPDSVVRLEPYVVTATRGGHARLSDQPLAGTAADVVSATRARSRIAADVLRDLPGVQVQQTSAGQGAVILRGLLGNQVLVLVDGVPLNNSTFRDGPGQYLATVDPETIERVEVIRGPASVLYGSDAQGGVVNLITSPHPNGRSGVRLAGTASSATDGYRTRASVGYARSRLRAKFGGTFMSEGDLAPGGSLPKQTPTAFDAAGLDAQVEVELHDRHRITGVAHYFRMDSVPRYDRYVTFRSSNGLGADAEHRFDPQTRQLTYVRHRYERRGSLLASLETTLSLSVQREGRIRQRRTSAGPDPEIEHTRDDVYTPGVSIVGTTDAIAMGGSVQITWGLDFYHDAISARGFVNDTSTGAQAPITRTTGSVTRPSGRFPDGADANRLGVFVAGETNVAPWLRVSVGARWSRFDTAADVGDQFGGAVQNVSADLIGQFGLVLQPHDQVRVAFRLAEGFRAPNLYDLTNVGPVPGGIVVPNPDAVPERSLSAELTFRLQSPVVSFAVTGYRTTIHDFVDRTLGVFRGDSLFRDERVFQGQNVGTAWVRGVEVEAAARRGAIDLRATLLYTRGDQRDALGMQTPMSKIPPLGGHAHLRWTVHRLRTAFSYHVRWAAPQRRLGGRDESDPRIAPGGTDGFAIHSIAADAALTSDLSIAAGVANVRDALYREHASGVDSAGRDLWIGVSWRHGF